LRYKPQLVSSLQEFEQHFGGHSISMVTLSLHPNSTLNGNVIVPQPRHRMHYALRLYFDNGGGPCLIVSAGRFKTVGKREATRYRQLLLAINAVAEVDDTTLHCLPDAHLLSGTRYFDLLKVLLNQAARLKVRLRCWTFTIRHQ
jgi:uncharacterized protein